MKFLLDTTWIVEHLRGNREIVSRIQELQEEGLAVSIISVAELYEGILRSRQQARNEQSLREFLRAVPVLDLTLDICRVYGQQKAKLVQKGTVIGALDLLIASTALVHGLTILTHDRDFQRVGELSVTVL